ncbi:MAG: hypothetical protein EBU90_26905, partial [Proteobacteria bacterium]|nr:hypothetical protein [Pseudomonadota bacterium]
FVKPGKDLSVEEVESFIEKFKADYVELQSLGPSLKAAGASHFGNRLKDRLSLHEKMQGRLKERSLNTTTDVIAARSLATSIDNQKSILEHMKKNFDLVEVEDSSSKARPDGYRAIHVLFKTSSGKISELQIKTHRQQIFSGFTHDTIYKPSKELAKEFGKGEDGKPRNKEVSQYLTSLSDYLHGLDNGEKDSPEKRPKEPKILSDNGIKFPWNEVDKLNKQDLSEFSKEEQSQKQKFKQFEGKEKGKVKHFVVVRSPKKQNLEIKEFDTFEEADGFVKKNMPKHEGQMPMGYSESKQEFLKVFSEYRPEGWDSETKKSIIFEADTSIFNKSMIQKFYITDLSKAFGHKYLRKYRKNSKWIYIYQEPKGRPEILSEEEFSQMKRLADAGDRRSKEVIDEMEEISEEKVKLLQDMATNHPETDSGKRAQQFLDKLGVSSEKKDEKVEEKPKKEDTEPKKQDPETKKPRKSRKKAENPRENAENESKELEENYKKYDYVSKNSITNLGEDVWGSARHKRANWKGLDAAEKDGKAEEMIQREALLEMEPHGFGNYLNEANFLSVLTAHYCLKRFPVRPSLVHSEYEKKAKTDVVFYTNDKNETMWPWDSRVKSDPNFAKNNPEFKPTTAGDLVKQARKDYYEAFQIVKNAAEDAFFTI